MAAKKKPLSRMHGVKKIKFDSLFRSLVDSWASLANDKGYMPFPPGATVETGLSTNGKAGRLVLSVTYGFLARLPFVDPGKAAQWEKIYADEVQTAVARYGGNCMEWENLSTAGQCCVMIAENGKYDDSIVFTGIVKVDDDKGETLGEFNLFQGTELPGAITVENYSKESMEILADAAASTLTSPALCIHLKNRDFIETIMEMATDLLDRESSWYLRKLDEGSERTAWTLRPISVDNVSEEMAPRIREITGTLAHPVFPRKEAVFVLAIAYPDQTSCVITVNGPFPMDFMSIQAGCDAYKYAENPEEKNLFSRTIDIPQLIGDCKKDKDGFIGKAVDLAADISGALGMMAICGETDFQDEEDDPKN